MSNVRPYGSWPSPITAALLVEQAVSLGQVESAGERVWWLEGRPAEAGRQVVVTWAPGEDRRDAIPEGYSARTLVHEYGGGSYAVAPDGDAVFFSNFTDQRLYRVDGAGGEPRPLTPEPPAPMAYRYADMRVAPDGSSLICVRERHLDGEVVNDIVAVDTNGEGEPAVVVVGADFVSAPRYSPDGRRLAWLCWSHPHMPWDGTELWEAEVGPDGLAGACHVAGGPEESVSQPRFSPGGTLHYVSDRTGWWNLYTSDLSDPEDARPLHEMEAEFSGPDWIFGQSTYDFLDEDRIVVTWSQDAIAHIGVLDRSSGELREWESPYTTLGSLRARGNGNGVVAVAASSTEEPAVVLLDEAGALVETLQRSRPTTVDPGYVSAAQPIQFSTEGSRTAHALWYPPANKDVDGPDDELPPLIVMIHGGPTAAASPALSLSTQYWTSRGFAVVDVNYGGSTGYGREYRQRLNGRWGIVDVDDCVNAARHLSAEGLVDSERLLIRGGSAGGYTTLCALTFRDDFSGGASYFGVADAEALAADTHKFESRYLDGLIGPYPEAQELYRERSPIHAADRLSAPLILLQGLEDKVVPPAQAEVMVDALRLKGLPFAYVAFEGEQHGFRKAESIIRAIEAELSFYGQVLGFEPADDIEPVEVENLSR